MNQRSRVVKLERDIATKSKSSRESIHLPSSPAVEDPTIARVSSQTYPEQSYHLITKIYDWTLTPKSRGAVESREDFSDNRPFRFLLRYDGRIKITVVLDLPNLRFSVSQWHFVSTITVQCRTSSMNTKGNRGKNVISDNKMVIMTVVLSVQAPL